MNEAESIKILSDMNENQPRSLEEINALEFAISSLQSQARMRDSLVMVKGYLEILGDDKGSVYENILQALSEKE